MKEVLNFSREISFLLLFRSSHFSFLVFGHFWRQSYEYTKILRNPCLHFARQDGQDGKKQKENHATKMTKITQNQKTKIWGKRNIKVVFSIQSVQSTYIVCLRFMSCGPVSTMYYRTLYLVVNGM